MEKNKEIRSFVGECRLKEGRKVTGYAVVFNSKSEDLGGFTERISEHALDGVIESSDVLALLNHSTARGVLARSRNGEGSLKLTIDNKGLLYEFEAPRTALGDELLEGIKRGDIYGSSFSFLVDKDSWSPDYDERVITKIGRLFDVSPVYTPAYSETSVKLRSDRITNDKYYAKLLGSLDK